MIPLKELLLQYKSEHKALPAFNIDSFEIYQAVESAVKETSLSCLVQLSSNEDTFIEAERLLMLVRKANLEGLPIYLNMDHGQDTDRLLYLARLGFDMVHFDGSLLPYSKNLTIAKDFIATAKSFNSNLVVEAEFNHINLVDKGVSPDSYTAPAQAQEFLELTNADLLAVSIGNLHGVNVDLPEKINLDLFSQITSALPQQLFTLHGGSGIPLDQVKLAISLGIVKININTDLRLAFKKSLLESINHNSSEKIYDYLAPAISRVKEIVKQKLINFST